MLLMPPWRLTGQRRGTRSFSYLALPCLALSRRARRPVCRGRGGEIDGSMERTGQAWVDTKPQTSHVIDLAPPMHRTTHPPIPYSPRPSRLARWAPSSKPSQPSGSDRSIEQKSCRAHPIRTTRAHARENPTPARPPMITLIETRTHAPGSATQSACRLLPLFLALFVVFDRSRTRARRDSMGRHNSVRLRAPLPCDFGRGTVQVSPCWLNAARRIEMSAAGGRGVIGRPAGGWGPNEGGANAKKPGAGVEPPTDARPKAQSRSVARLIRRGPTELRKLVGGFRRIFGRRAAKVQRSRPRRDGLDLDGQRGTLLVVVFNDAGGCGRAPLLVVVQLPAPNKQRPFAEI